MELNHIDAHCIARLLQMAVFGKGLSILNACQYCHYPCHKLNKTGEPATRFNDVMLQLQNETGVDLSPGIYGSLEPHGFPYKKFLKNANEEVKEHFRNFFKDV
ncbi:hypothetical protein [Anaerovibrio lipolyticus]|uniref:hypothetical protein n=1 Tax=Anaerovibrio lipolyticus TaxID=82374 RepID=UPI0026EA86F1|nr:hypothetical protein [Anaerovibrio lipolyticus]MBE6105972.1 hypothetical protein [Anaerovibrio lipolyticus]